MNHLISINDKTKTGKTILDLIKTISKNESGILFLNKELHDTISVSEFSHQLKAEVIKKLETKNDCSLS